MRLGELDLEAAAKAAAGNWREFVCFAWHRRPDDADNWTIVYSHNRDSDLLDQSNAAAIDKAMEPFLGGDVVVEHHHHWACGWIDGYSIRVFRRGRITKAFRTYHALKDVEAAVKAVKDELIAKLPKARRSGKVVMKDLTVEVVTEEVLAAA